MDKKNQWYLSRLTRKSLLISYYIIPLSFFIIYVLTMFYENKIQYGKIIMQFFILFSYSHNKYLFKLIKVVL